MSKSSLYKFAAIGLLLLNLVLLAYLLFGGFNKHHAPPPGGMMNAAKKEMNLTNEQHEVFLKSAKKHQRDISRLEERQAALSHQYFLQEETSGPETQDSLLAQVATLEKEKIERTRQHFAEIKAMLKPAQVAGYEKFLQKVLGRIFKNKKQALPPPPLD